MAKAPELALKVGDPAPAFSTPSTDGTVVTLSGLAGKHVILYFYPKDDTSGCTKEACAFRDAYSQFRAKGAVILGVSVNAYGAWGEKSFMGRKYQGTYRITYHIDPKGKIAHIWPTVKPEAHAAEVLAALG